jgi:hypothetical protein
MTPPDLHGFFTATASVAGALIGLLFVAISVASDRIVAENAAQAHRVRAAAALTAFINALTVSLFALLPGEKVAWTALIVSVVGLVFVIASLLSLRRVRHSQPNEMRDALFLVGLVATFSVQFVYGLQLIMHPRETSRIETIAILTIVCFLIGIGRSWELIGGPSIRLRQEVGAIIRSHDEPGSEEPTDPPS